MIGKQKKDYSKPERKSEIPVIIIGFSLILISLFSGLYFVPKAYASQHIINRKGAQVMEYMDISIFCALGIITGIIVLTLSIKEIRNKKQK